TTLRRSLVDHVARTESLDILVNRDLKLYGRPDETREQFLARCHEAADRASDEAAAKLRDKYELRMDKIRLALDEAISRAEDLAEDAEAKRRAEQANGVTGLITGLFSGRRNTRSLTRDAEKALGRSSTGTSQLAAAERKADTLSTQLSDLEQEIVEDILKIDAEWDGKAERVETIPLRLAKADVSVVSLSLVWIPAD
ncbi:MAG TPA: hypothetical protein VF855_03905, partial [Acidimicrobiales bacterium]